MACGESATINEATLASYDYAAFTGQASTDDGAPPPLCLLPAAERLSARALADLVAGGGRKPVVLDVRPPAQFAIGHLEGAKKHAPLPSLPGWLVRCTLPHASPIPSPRALANDPARMDPCCRCRQLPLRRARSSHGRHQAAVRRRRRRRGCAVGARRGRLPPRQ